MNVTPAYLFRKVGDTERTPTILFDEIDTVFGPKAKDNEEIRGLLNAGHRRGAVAGRCVVKGKTIETEEIPAYCAVAMAGLGGLPDTILSRSVIIRMKRRAPTEQVEAFRRRVHVDEGNALRDELADWVASVVGEMRDAWPEIPQGIDDRDADVWEPLLAVADAAGGDWPERSRVAAVALVADSKGSTPSLGIRLLSDIRTVFGESADSLTTAEILNLLREIEDAPWGDLRGKPLDARGLSRRLADYQVAPINVRAGGRVQKGYRRESLYDAWERYLPNPLSLSQQESATSATPLGSESLGIEGLSREEADEPQAASASNSEQSDPDSLCHACGDSVASFTAKGLPVCGRHELGVTPVTPGRTPRIESGRTSTEVASATALLCSRCRERPRGPHPWLCAECEVAS